jgi:hypothetical protein
VAAAIAASLPRAARVSSVTLFGLTGLKRGVLHRLSVLQAARKAPGDDAEMLEA